MSTRMQSNLAGKKEEKVEGGGDFFCERDKKAEKNWSADA